ncbi:MAG TPA: hypothetical protein VGG75_38140 [Trebonia sp.]
MSEEQCALCGGSGQRDCPFCNNCPSCSTACRACNYTGKVSCPDCKGRGSR